VSVHNLCDVIEPLTKPARARPPRLPFD
jgi:hypothetical protein